MTNQATLQGVSSILLAAILGIVVAVFFLVVEWIVAVYRDVQLGWEEKGERRGAVREETGDRQGAVRYLLAAERRVCCIWNYAYKKLCCKTQEAS